MCPRRSSCSLPLPLPACVQPPGEKKAKAAAQAMSMDQLKQLIAAKVQAKPANSDDDFVSQPPPASTSPPMQVWLAHMVVAGSSWRSLPGRAPPS